MSFLEINTGRKIINEVTCECGNIEIRSVYRENATCAECKKKKIKQRNFEYRKIRNPHVGEYKPKKMVK